MPCHAERWSICQPVPGRSGFCLGWGPSGVGLTLHGWKWTGAGSWEGIWNCALLSCLLPAFYVGCVVDWDVQYDCMVISSWYALSYIKACSPCSTRRETKEILCSNTSLQGYFKKNTNVKHTNPESLFSGFRTFFVRWGWEAKQRSWWFAWSCDETNESRCRVWSILPSSSSFQKPIVYSIRTF